MPLDLDKVKRYRDLREAQKRSKAESEGLREEADRLEQELLEDFVEEGVQNVRVDGSTVFLHRQIWAGKEEGVETPAVVSALKTAGLGHLVGENYNGQTLAAYLRDLDRNEEPMPAELVGVIKPVEVFQIRQQRARPKS